MIGSATAYGGERIAGDFERGGPAVQLAYPIDPQQLRSCPFCILDRDGSVELEVSECIGKGHVSVGHRQAANERQWRVPALVRVRPLPIGVTR